MSDDTRREASHGNPIFGGSMRDLLAGAASLLKDKWTPDDGQLRTQWDRDVDEWLAAAAPLIEEEEQLQPLQSGCNSIAINALDDIREIVQAAMDASDLAKLDLKRILELCGKEER